jgi:hypothetical protein
MTARNRVFRRRDSRSGIAILVLSCFVFAIAYANSSATDAVTDKSFASITIVEKEPSAETVKLVNNIFERAERLTVFYTTESEMGRVGYNLKMARDHARFQVSIRCRGACKFEFQHLRDDLAKALLIRGNCPGPIGSVVDFVDQAGKPVATIFATAEGQCLTLHEKAYFLKDLSFRKKLEALSRVLQ